MTPTSTAGGPLIFSCLTLLLLDPATAIALHFDLLHQQRNGNGPFANLGPGLVSVAQAALCIVGISPADHSLQDDGKHGDIIGVS